MDWDEPPKVYKLCVALNSVYLGVLLGVTRLQALPLPKQQFQTECIRMTLMK